MSASLLDGRLVSDLILTNLSQQVQELKKQGVSPKLVIVLVGKNPASVSYIRQKSLAAEKVGLAHEEIHLPESITTDELVVRIQTLNEDKAVHGILVQLPLPDHVSAPLVTRAIDPAKDVDGFGAYNLGKALLSAEFEDLAPCTPRGIVRLLEHYKISPAGKHVVILGRSNIVGKPLAVMLINRDATVTVCHSKTKDLATHTLRADILIAAVGKPKMITKEMVKDGAVVIDVGINKVENKIVGDCDFEEVSKKASFISPVPGGIGPMTVASLMENVVTAATRLSQPSTLYPQP